jgi:hypothetical protein
MITTTWRIFEAASAAWEAGWPPPARARGDEREELRPLAGPDVVPEPDVVPALDVDVVAGTSRSSDSERPPELQAATTEPSPIATAARTALRRT